jgi:hypothetical protein
MKTRLARALRPAFAFALAALTLTLGACDLTELNEDPNNPTTVETANLFTNAEQDLATELSGSFTLGRFSNLYAQYWTQNQYTEEDRYQFPSRRQGVVRGHWEDFYLILNDLQEIKRLARENPDAVSLYGPADNQVAMATILQSYIFQVMTDIWGPIPFDEALQGRDGEFSASYTPQPQIYAALLDSLTAASAAIDVDQPTFPRADLIYGGDMAQWKRLANSLKMRVALRAVEGVQDAPGESGLTLADLEAALTSALEDGVLTDGDAALIPFSGAAPYQNPIYLNYLNGRDDWAVPVALLGTMNVLEDPRRDVYATAIDGAFVPYTYGLPRSQSFARFAEGGFSRPGDALTAADTPAFLMLYDEVLFIQVEAAERGLLSGDAAGLYRDAIRASVVFWHEFDATESLDAGAVEAYLDRVPYDNGNEWAPVATGDQPTWKQTLGIQKWLALYMQGVQGWAEFRRLDFEGILQTPPGNPGQDAFGNPFPLRIPYPQIEISTNPGSYQAALEELGGDDTQGVRLWWDVD